MQIDSLTKIYGNSIEERSYRFPVGTPNYISYGYHPVQLIWNKRPCLLVVPENKDINLMSLKKQIGMIQKISSLPVIVQLDRLSALQRTSLIESDIAFICGQGQIFIPFWGSYFEEKIINPKEPAAKMTGNAQLVFLYLFYNSVFESEMINQTQLSAILHLPKSTCSRAVQLLKGIGLIATESDGNANWISLLPGKDIVSDAYSYMSSPIHKLIYVKSLPQNIDYKLSGIKALSDMSMLSNRRFDAGYAVNRNAAKLIDSGIMIDKQTFRDFGGEIVEVWKYDPFLLSSSEHVDDISLLLSLDSDTDERVQKELDAIRIKYKINKGG